MGIFPNGFAKLEKTHAINIENIQASNWQQNVYVELFNSTVLNVWLAQ